MYSAGYDNAVKADEFYKNVADEINLAIDEKKVDAKNVMSNPLMSPYRKGYIGDTLKTMLNSFACVITLYDIGIIESDEIDADINIENFDVLNKCEYKYNKILSIIVVVIIAVYGFFNTFLFMISFVIYLILSKNYIISHIQKIKNVWLITTACILSAIVLVAGVSYTHISAFDSIYSVYLVGAYPLISIFMLLNIFFYLEKRKDLNSGVLNEEN